MENRIKIGDEWYVKESSTTQTKPEDSIHIDPILTEHILFETEECIFDVSRMYRDDEETFYDGVTVDFTDKRGSYADWKSEDWDNYRWLIGVLQNDEESLASARESLSEQGISELKYVIRQLVDRGWIKID